MNNQPLTGLTPDLTNAFNQITGGKVSATPNAGPSRADEIRALGKSASSPSSQNTSAFSPLPQIASQVKDIGNEEATTLQTAGADVTKNAKTALGAGAADTKDYGSFGANFGADLAKRLASLGHIAGDVATTTFAPIMHTVAALVPPEIKGDYTKSINWAADKITNNPTILGALNKANDALDANPDLKQALTSDLPGALSLLGADKVSDLNPEITKGSFSNATKGLVDDVKTGAQTAKSVVSQAASNVKDAVANGDSAVKGVADDWEKPTTVNKPAFNKARAVLTKSPETPQFLAEHGLNPSDHIEDGKYVTTDSAEALKDTAGKLSRDTLRPSLQQADYTTPKTNIDEIVKQAMDNVGKDTGTTAADKNAVIKAIQTEGEALKAEHPEGMSLTDMHDNKITYSKNAGYSPIKDPAANIKATANRSLSSSLQKMVEGKAPASLPVGDFNAQLAKYYQAADYLDALNGKTAPVSLGQKVARGIAKFGGAALGGELGGGVVSEFAGYQIGKALESMLENLTNPMRATFLRNLEITNPEAFSKVQEYIKTQAEGNTGIPRLAAPDFIAPPAPSEETQMQGRAQTILPK